MGTVTVISVRGFCAFPPSSTARLIIVTRPGVVGVQLKLQAVVPVAALKVAPPSTDTSTLTTDLPPALLAVPVMVTGFPIGTVAPSAGDVIVEDGGASTVRCICAGGFCTLPALSTARRLI